MSITRALVAATASLAVLLAVGPAEAADAGRGFYSLLPPGQGESVSSAELGSGPPPTFVNQLEMFTGLVGAAPTLRRPDLVSYFKPAPLGIPAGETPVSVAVPRPGVRIRRDRFNVPHIQGPTRSDVMFGAGYAQASDRLFLMDALRQVGRGRLTALSGPGADDANLERDADTRLRADYSEAELRRMIARLSADFGREGAGVEGDLRAYLAGINAYVAEVRHDRAKLPVEYLALNRTPRRFVRADLAASAVAANQNPNSVLAQAQVGELLQQLRRRFGAKAEAVLADFRRANDPERPTTTGAVFKFPKTGPVDPRAVAVPDAGSLRALNPVESAGSRQAGLREAVSPASAFASGLAEALELPQFSSFAFLVDRSRSASGRALGYLGPQIGFNSPSIFMEISLQGGGFHARGAALVGLAPYPLVGRGRHFAWSGTNSVTSQGDEFAERLCEPGGRRVTRESRHYVRHGRCVPLRVHEVELTIPAAVAGSPRSVRIRTLRSVHGVIQRTGRVHGHPVAYARAYTAFQHEYDFIMGLARLARGEVSSPEAFRKAMRFSNSGRNWFYIDDNDVSFVMSGSYPRRARGTDADLPTWGTGRWDWRGFDPERYTFQRVPYRLQPHATNPRSGWIVNWNNAAARGWNQHRFGQMGSVFRSQLMTDDLVAATRRGRELALEDLVRLGNDAHTADLVGRRIYPLMRRVLGRQVNRRIEPFVETLDRWADAGSPHRDRDGDGTYDLGAGTALMDAWFARVPRAIFRPVLGKAAYAALLEVFPNQHTAGSARGSGYTGWYGYVEKDLRGLLGDKVRGKFSRGYCGRGSLAHCRKTLTRTLLTAAARLEARYGKNLDAWRPPTTCEQRTPPACDQIVFSPIGATRVDPVPWQNRSTYEMLAEFGR